MLNHFELDQLKVFEKSDCLLPIGWGKSKKAPMLFDWPIVEGYSIEELKKFKNAYGIGLRCDNIFCLDVDGASAARWARGEKKLLDSSTFQIHRNTSANHFKYLFRPTPEQVQQIPTNDRGKKEFQFKVVTDEICGEAAEFFYSNGRQVIVSGKHFASGGDYQWFENRYPQDIKSPTELEWATVIELAKEHLERKPKESLRRSSSSWRTLNPCPICGRNEHNVCQQSKDKDCIRCFVGNSYSPPKNLPAGKVILDEWAFCRLQFVGWGEFAIFVRHKSSPLQKLRRSYV